MDQPSFQGISAIQETEAMFSSRYTDAPSILVNHQQNYHSTRMFAIGTLQSWGLELGDLPYSKNNELTLKCLLELISFRQKDLSFRIKVKEDLSKIQFQKQKYESLLKQSKRILQQKDKQIGKLQNELIDFKNKIKKNQSAIKKQKDDDKKIIAMLKSKSQQVMHQIKKKDTEINKIKEQMKKSVKDKSINSSAVKASLNSFQIFSSFQQKKQLSKNTTQNLNEQKFNFIVNKCEKQKKNLMNQNTLLRQKLYDIREILVQFAEWIDVQLFGIKTATYKSSFIVNHSLLFKKGTLINDLNQIVQNAKQGIQQIQQTCAEKITEKKESLTRQKKPSIMQGSNTERKMLKKPSTSQNIISLQSQNKFTKNQARQTSNKRINHSQKSIYNQNRRPMRVQKLSLEELSSSPLIQNDKYQIPYSKQNQQYNQKYFQDQLLSDIVEGDHDNSIVSHISITEIKNQKNKYDKWDILFSNNDQNE